MAGFIRIQGRVLSHGRPNRSSPRFSLQRIVPVSHQTSTLVRMGLVQLRAVEEIWHRVVTATAFATHIVITTALLLNGCNFTLSKSARKKDEGSGIWPTHQD